MQLVTPSVVPSAVRIEIRICTINFHVSFFIIPNFSLDLWSLCTLVKEFLIPNLKAAPNGACLLVACFESSATAATTVVTATGVFATTSIGATTGIAATTLALATTAAVAT